MKLEADKISRPDWVKWLEEQHTQSLSHTLGMRVESYDPEAVVVAIDVDSRLYQPAGVVHGGVYVVMAESAASIAAALRVDLTQFLVMGMEINANHLRPARTGTLRAIARCLHEGRTTHVYHIEVLDELERKVCVSRCTVAVRPRREPLQIAEHTK